MVKKIKKWYKPKTETGWDRDMGERERRALVYKAFKNEPMPYLSSARAMQALANIHKSSPTGDPVTAEKANKDAEYFFKKHDETGK